MMYPVGTVDQLRLDEQERRASAEHRRLTTSADPVRRGPVGLRCWLRNLSEARRARADERAIDQAIAAAPTANARQELTVLKGSC
jgi:hypothetical protein